VGVRLPLTRGEEGAETLSGIERFVMEAPFSNALGPGVPIAPLTENIGDKVNGAGGELGRVGNIGENVGDGLASASSVSDFEPPLALLSNLLPFLCKPLNMPLLRDSCWISSEESLAASPGYSCIRVADVCADGAASLSILS